MKTIQCILVAILLSAAASCRNEPSARESILRRWPELEPLLKLAPHQIPPYKKENLETKAAAGDPEAAALLVQEAYRGDIFNRDGESAVLYLPRAMRLGHPMALYFAAVHQEIGLINRPANPSNAGAAWVEAYEALKFAPEPWSGHQYDALCLILWKGKGDVDSNPAKALEYCLKASEYDLPRPQARRGWFHEHGECGAEQSAELAFKYYQRSAELGGALGYYHLGRCHFEGIGTQQNRDVALGCLAMAAMKGLAEAHIELEEIMENGAEKFTVEKLSKSVITTPEEPEFRFEDGDRIIVSSQTEPSAKWTGIVIRAERGRYLVRVESIESAAAETLRPCPCTGQLELNANSIGSQRWILESCASES